MGVGVRGGELANDITDAQGTPVGFSYRALAMYTGEHKFLKRGAVLLLGLSACLFSYQAGLNAGSATVNQSERQADELGRQVFKRTMHRAQAESRAVAKRADANTDGDR